VEISRYLDDQHFKLIRLEKMLTLLWTVITDMLLALYCVGRSSLSNTQSMNTNYNVGTYS